MSTSSHFHFLSELGETKLPDQMEIARLFAETGQEVMLVLDSSVCLDITDLIRKKQSSNADKVKVFSLVEYVQKTKVSWTPLCALIESCYDRETFDIKEEKLWDIKNKLDFAFAYPSKLLKKFAYNYETDYRIKEKRKLGINSIKPLTENLNCYYAALLKIQEMANVSLKQEAAEKNIEHFVDWMVNELGILLGPEYSLAIRIFGGDNDFRSMLKINASKETTLKAAWGTAWDLFHSRISRNRIQLLGLLGKNVHPIFVTKDGRLFNLLAPHVEADIRNQFSRLTLTDKNEYPPHYSHEFIDRLNRKILNLGVERFSEGATINDEKVNSIIRKLEAE